MDLLGYNKVSPKTVADELAKELKLDWSANEKIKDYLDDNYTIVDFRRRKKSNFLFRITGIFYLLLLLILLIWMPFKWILTGNAYYKFDSRFYRFRKAWADKL